MSVTRTTIYAKVTFDKVYKDESGTIVTDTFDDTIANCDTRKKAEAMLSKEHKNAIVSIKDIKFISETRKMPDDTFYENSEVVSTKEVDEEELIAKAESRKRSK